jgi:hypothetical protein
MYDLYLVSTNVQKRCLTLGGSEAIISLLKTSSAFKRGGCEREGENKLALTTA